MPLLPEDPQQQKRLLLGLLPLLLLIGYWYFFHGTRAEEVEDMRSRLESLETNNRRAQALAQEGAVEDLVRRLELYEQHMERLEQLIPGRDEVPELLNMIATRAEATDVQLALMRPQEDVASDFYRRVTYEMGVFGSYHEIGAFLSAVGSLPRIITPINLTLRRRGDSQTELEAGFRIETYVLPQPEADSTQVAGA